MKRSRELPDREPDFEGSGALTSGATRHPVSGRVWLPRSTADKPLVYLSLRHFLEPGPHRLELRAPWLDDSVVEVIGHRVWLPRQSERRHAEHGSLDAIHAEAHPKILRIQRPFGSEGNAHLSVRLSDNLLLRPIQTRILNIEVGLAYKTHEKHELQDRLGTAWQFQRHLITEQAWDELGVLSRWELYAHATLSPSATYDVVAIDVLPALEELLTLAAFASSQRTSVLGWELGRARCHETVYWPDHVSPGISSAHSWNDVLVQRADFSEFIELGIGKLRELDHPSRRLLTTALNVATPDNHDYLESRFLGLFSALESALLLFRKQNDLVHLIKSGPWKHVQRTLCAALESESGRFEGAERLELAKSALIGIKRVPLEYAFSEFVKRYGLHVDDLWPVTDHKAGVSLLQLRNRLSHGEEFPDHLNSGLMYASLSLQTLVQRMTLALLGWKIERSACCPDNVARWTDRLATERAAFASVVGTN